MSKQHAPVAVRTGLARFSHHLLFVTLLVGLCSWAHAAITVDSNLPAGVLGQAYNATLQPSGGTQPYTHTVASGSLPTGLVLSPGGVLSGTPQAAGQFAFAVQSTDSLNVSAVTNLTIRVTSSSGLVITNTSLPAGRIVTAYDVTLASTGGSSPYLWDLVLGGGTLPAGLSFSSAGRISGTPTAAGVFPIIARVTDGGANSFQTALTLRVDAASLSISTNSLQSASANVPYSQTLSASGGTPPYSFDLLSGTLPPGVTLSSNGSLAGTPTSAGNYNFFARVTDAAGTTAQASFSIVVSSSGPRIVISSLPTGIVNQSFSGALVAQGGTAPYAFSILSGTLPNGLVLSSTGALTGTPLAGGVFPVTVRVLDATGQSAQADLLVNINSGSFAISTSSVRDGFVNSPYNVTLTTSGGTAPYTFNLLSGTLPPGVSLSSAGVLNGTPTTLGTYNFVVRGSDASGSTAQMPLTIRIQASNLSFSLSGFANGQVGQAYSSTLAAVNGAAPYTFSLESGSLPPGLTLNANGNLSGTPTSSGVFLPSVRVVDANNASTVTTIPIFVGSTGLNFTSLTLPTARTNQAYSTTLQAAGGMAPYTFALASGTLPTGLTLSPSGLLSGTPTQTTGTPFTVRVSDGAGATSLVTYYFNIGSSAITLSSPPLAAGQLGLPYSSTFLSTGGAGTYSYSLESGSLPPGLTLNSNGTLTGTPSASGSYIFNLRATDGNSQSALFTQVLTIGSSQLGFGSIQLPNIIAGSSYFATFTGVGGTPPYTFSLVTGTLPTGITLGTNGNLTGTSSASGSYPITVRITDATGASATATTTLTVTTGNALTISTTALPTARRGQAYTAVVTASGGRAPYFYLLGPGSSVPPGLSFSETGILSGTPTTDGTYTFVVRTQDFNNEIVAKTLSLTVTSAALDISNTSLPNGIVGTPYSVNLTASGGQPIYTFVVAGGNLPPGLSLSAGGVLSGTPTVAGAYPIVIRLGDANGVEFNKAYTILVGSSALAFVSTSLPAGYVSQNYLGVLQAAGGVPPYRFSVDSGSLPDGLTLSPEGILTGSPTRTGQSPVTFKVVDATGASAFNTITIGAVQSIIRFGFTSIPSAIVGQSFSFTPTGAGGTGPFVFTVLSGLPPGITVAPNGTISGVATQEGTFNLLLRAQDANGAIVEGTFPLVVNAAGFRITTQTLPNARLNEAYSQTLATSGASGAVVFNLQSGSLPAGINLSTGGVLSGTPTVAGISNFVIRAVDGAGTNTTVNLALTVAAPVVNFVTNTLPSGTVNQAYSQSITVTGGSAPYNFILNGGSLPAGLTLSSSGVIAGTPTASGTFTFGVRAIDSLGQTNTSEFLIGIGSVGSPSLVAVVNAANYAANGAAPGEILVLYGTNLGPANLAVFSLVNNTVPATLGGTRVLFDGVPAPVIYSSATQVSAVAPFSLAGKTSTRVVVEYLGVPAATIQVPVRNVKPAIFTLDASGNGPGAILNQNGTLNTATNPAAKQSYISLYVTGVGQTNPASQDGQVVMTAANLLAPVTATIGGQAAEVQYAGSAPGLVPGVAQINLRVPAGATTGSNSVQLTVGGIVSSGNVIVFVQ